MYRVLPIVLALAFALGGCGATTQQTQTQGDLSVSLETNPATPLADRPTTFRLQISRSGTALDGAYVTLKRQMPGMSHMEDSGSLVAQSLGGGRYEAQSAFAMGSRWDVAVAVQVAEEQPQVMTFPLEVDQP
jgi:hypothetical protein